MAFVEEREIASCISLITCIVVCFSRDLPCISRQTAQIDRADVVRHLIIGRSPLMLDNKKSQAIALFVLDRQ